MVSSPSFSADAGQRPFGPVPTTHDDSSSTTSTPWILDTLFRNLSYDLEQVADIIDPILTAQNHCHRTDWYVQGIMAEQRAFLSTNINPDRAIQVTLCSTRWLLGQGRRCAVTMPQTDIADCHAALNFTPGQGFFISDLGSNGGTWVNGRRLAPAQRQYLQDGDLIKLGSLRFECLEQHCDQSAWQSESEPA